MNSLVRNQLNRINKRFYREQADGFSRTRRYAWESFSLLDEPMEHMNIPVPVLDIGCGNGRLGEYIQERVKCLYTGVDVSSTLLDKARNNVGNEHEYVQADIVEQSLTTLKLPHKSYKIVALVGVMHHIPDSKLRLSRLTEAYRMLSPGGVLLVTFWQFAKFERFRKHIREWPSVEIADSEVEEGDYLLTFGEGKHLRYCHHFSDEEVDEVVGMLPGEILCDVQADGKESHYNRSVLIRG